MRIVTVVRQYLAAAFLIVIGLIAYGCGDTASVNSSAELASLAVDPGSLEPAFSGGTTQYNVNLSSSITSVRVTAQPAVSGDTVTINGQNTTSSVITLGAAGTTTPVNIVVSGSGADPGGYTVHFVRAGLTGNNSLENLTVSSGPLDPAFDENLQSYTVDVANNVGSIAVTPTLSDPDARMTVNGQATNSGQARTITLGPAGQTTIIPIVVTAQNGSPKTYQVTVSRGVSGNNNLQGLTVSPGPLTPTFSATRVSTSYTVNVASSVSSVRVTPTRQDPNATITVNGTPTTSGQASQPIQLGDAGSNTPIIIIVTAQNGTQKTYTVGVTRAALGGNNNLSGLSVSPGSLDPNFSANTTNYTVDVGSGVSSVTVTPTRQDSNATITMNGSPATSGQGRSITLNGAGSNTVINIVVTAQNGSQKTYSVTVSRAALGGNNNLQSLTVSPGTLSPPFNANRARTDYAVNDISSSATSILVTAAPQDSNATVTINTQGGNSRSIPLPGGPSSTEIEVRVIAPNGNDKTYPITVTQPAPATPPAPTSAPDLIAEDDSCLIVANVCFPPTSDVDNITNVATPRFRISPPGTGETPSLYVDGNKDASASFDSAANTLRPSAALSDGDHQITYTVTNAGGESQPSPSLTVNINTVVQPPGGGGNDDD